MGKVISTLTNTTYKNKRKDAERETVKLQPRFQTADKLRMGVKNSAAVSHM